MKRSCDTMLTGRDRFWTKKMRHLSECILVLLVCLPLLLKAETERTNVFFIHGVNCDLEAGMSWASEMYKRLWQAGAKMRYCPVVWKSDIGSAANYQENVSNAFETARLVAQDIGSVGGRCVVIAHSLGTLVAASAIQDHGANVAKLIMLDSAIPAEAFDPDIADDSPENHLVHDAWTGYTNACWTANWHKLFPVGDSRSKLTWKGRFASVAPIAVNFYSSGDEVLEIYADSHNPAFYSGFSPSGGWGDRYSWHKQELYKGRWSVLGLAVLGTTDWSGWGFSGEWNAETANAVNDFTVWTTNPVFNVNPPSIMRSTASRMECDYHLSQGIPALSPPTGRMDLTEHGVVSYDMNSARFKPNGWPRGDEHGEMAYRVKHSDVKNVAYFYLHPVFDLIVEEGGLR